MSTGIAHSDHSVIAIFARAPTLGKVKTRLARSVGEQKAVSLYLAFLEDTIANANNTGFPLYLVGTEKHDALDHLANQWNARFLLQQGDGLGDRLSNAYQQLLSEFSRAIVVGSDAPTLPSSYYQEASFALKKAPLVVVPAADGGFCLMGGTKVPDFRAVRWSTDKTLSDVLQNHSAYKSLCPWYDVDDIKSLRVLKSHLHICPQAAPRTAALIANALSDKR